MEIQGRTAIVTGGAVRVGRALALGLAARGAEVFIHYNSSSGPAEETAAEARRHGVRAAIGAADLSDPEAARGLVQTAATALGPPSILINSASGFPADTLQNLTAEGFRGTVDLTLLAPVLATQAFAAALPDDAEGAVVNVGDVRTRTPYVEHFSYIVAKGALDTFTLAAARSLAPRIRVNSVALGVILSPPGEGPEYAERRGRELPLERAGGTEPVVAATLALLENDFITGEIVRLDGGAHLI